MKASVEQQRSLAAVMAVDAELARMVHRRAHLPDEVRYRELQQEHAAATNRVAALGLTSEDLGAQIDRLESEIDAVRAREERDRTLLDSGASDAKQLTDLQHELETLQRRQASLEDSLLELMERREELAADQARELSALDALGAERAALEQVRGDAATEIDRTREERAEHRSRLIAGLGAELLGLYERQRTAAGVGAGLLQGRRCGACRIELDRGELARISAAPDDEVLRCPECRAILLRVDGFQR